MKQWRTRSRHVSHTIGKTFAEFSLTSGLKRVKNIAAKEKMH
jgi:hypothetical protein